MSVFANPNFVQSGLVLCLDARNEKCFPNTTPVQEHGYAEWYCFETSTVTYSIIQAGVSITERRADGTTAVMIATSSGPARGTFTITAGRFYIGVGGPINLVVEDAHHHIAPLTMVGTQFIWWAARSTTGTCYLYSPYKNTTIKFWDTPISGGITNSTPTQTFTLNAGSQTTFTFTTQPNFESTDILYLTSTEPILATTTQAGTDRTILSPASKYVYQRFISNYGTTYGTAPNTINTGCIYDPTHSVMAQSIADGSGGDTAQGLGLEFLCDRYSWGNVLSDYTIAFPYTATVNVSYWNGSAWVVWDTHTVTGNLTNPTVIARDGTLGPGVSATNVNGTAANMASDATLWKWEGTAPFYLCINDSVDDEFSVLGWMNTRVTSKNVNQYWIDLVSTNQLTVHGSLLHNSNGYWTLPNTQITNYLMQTNFVAPTGDVTVSCWFKSSFVNLNQAIFTYSLNGDNAFLLFTNNATTIVPYDLNNPVSITVPNMQNVWCNFVWTRNSTTGVSLYYMNGVYVGTQTISAGTGLTPGGHLIIGQDADLTGGGFDPNQSFGGDFARLDIYNRVLSLSEIETNFHAMRGRFGI